MPLSREEVNTVLAAGVLLFALAWYIWARSLLGRRRRKPQPFAARLQQRVAVEDGGESGDDLSRPLLTDVSNVEVLVKSRVPLALRQLTFYAAAAYYLVGVTVFAVRRLKNHGDAAEKLNRVLRLAAHAARCLAWVVAAKADAAEYRSSLRTRHTPLAAVFAVGSAVCAFREARLHVLEAPSLWALAAHAVLFAIGLHAASTRHVVLRTATAEAPPTPEELALELHEIVGFTWLDEIFEAKAAQAANEKLDEGHLPALLSGDRVDATYPELARLVEAMRIDLARAKASGKQRSKTFALFYQLAVLTRGHFICAGIFRFFYVFTGYLQPLALYIILKKFGQDSSLGWAAVGLLFFGPIVNSGLDNMQMFVQRRVATRCRGALMMLLYNKGARLDMSAGSGRVGEVVALMSADITNVLTSMAYAHWVWAPFLQLAITLTALFWLVGVAAFGALFVMFLNSIANGRIFKYLTKFNKEFQGARSKRLELITEMLQGARIIKMLSFEQGIANSVAKRRDDELVFLWKLLDCFVWIFTLINSTPPLMGLATFMLLAALVGHRFDAAEGFTALTLLDNLRFVLLQAPASINYIIQGWASLERIEDFLEAPETDPPPRSDDLAPGSVSVRHADFKWGQPPKDANDDDDAQAGEVSNPMHPLHQSNTDEVKDDALEVLESGGKDDAVPVSMTLSDVSLEVAPGKLCLVVGITGGGKSSLLSALLGEIRRVKGSVRVCGTTAYSPQSAWCQNATIRQNICFGAPYDAEHFEKCIEACALGADLDSFPAGDATEVGERGVTLSGGQQQRVALARAIYQNADIYILDDPLSAVDAHVGEHLFQRVIKDMLLQQGKTVILATHQISVALQTADQVVVLTADGTIAAQGTLREMQQTRRGQDLFAELMQGEVKKHGKQKDSSKARDADKEHATPAKAREGHRLVDEEERKTGAPAFSLFTLYIGSAGPLFLLGAALFISQQPIRYVQSAALTTWITRMGKGAKPLSMGAWLYCAWTAVYVLISLVAIVCQNLGALRASRVLHERLAWKVLRCPISWYDRSPVGRIQNRFSTDIQSIDRTVSNAVTFCIRGAVSPLVSLYAIGASVWWLLPCFLPMLIAAWRVAMNYLTVARDLKRIDSSTKSPVYATFNESLTGLSTLRAFDGAMERFKAKFSDLVDRTNSAELHLFAVNYHLSVRLNTLGAFVTGLTAVVLYSSAADGDGLSAPRAGLVLSYAISFTSAMIMLLRTYADLEISLNAVERIHEYLDLKIEDELEKPDDEARWLIDTPGEVRYERVTLKYPSQPQPALKSLSLIVQSGESLGICGRTGAGKSTALQSLLRLYPIESGRILIDGVDIATVGLRTLRGRIAIVPYVPVSLLSIREEN